MNSILFFHSSFYKSNLRYKVHITLLLKTQCQRLQGLPWKWKFDFLSLFHQQVLHYLWGQLQVQQVFPGKKMECCCLYSNVMKVSTVFDSCSVTTFSLHSIDVVDIYYYNLHLYSFFWFFILHFHLIMICCLRSAWLIIKTLWN